MSPREQNTHFEGWLKSRGAMLHHVTNGFAEGADRHDRHALLPRREHLEELQRAYE